MATEKPGPRFIYESGPLGQVSIRVAKDGENQLGGDSVQDFMHDPDARPPELPIPVQVIGFVMLGVLAGPIIGVLKLKTELDKLFSRGSQNPRDWPEDPRVQ